MLCETSFVTLCARPSVPCCAQYVDAQQVLLSSVTARAQLCKKCGSPLNPQTCGDVHIAWLSEATSRRLSKRLAGSSSAAGRSTRSSSGSGKDSKLLNRVVAVRRCLVSVVLLARRRPSLAGGIMVLCWSVQSGGHALSDPHAQSAATCTAVVPSEPLH